MIFSKIKKYYTLFILLGADEHTSVNELRKIKLLNSLCGVWYLIAVLMTIIDIIGYSRQNLTLADSLTISLLLNIFLISVQLIHYKKHFYAARLLYVIGAMVLTFIVTNYIHKGGLIEYFFLLIPATCLIFIDSKKMNYLILLVSYLCFALPNYYFKHYAIHTLNGIEELFLFLSIFILINYFKTLNQKYERALKDKTKELENINTFQSQFFINISHEIRTPLTLIKGDIDEIKTFSTSFPQATAIEERLNRQVGKITKMVDDVIDLARMESSDFRLNLKPVSISELISKLYLAFEPLFQQKQIHFELTKRNRDYLANADIIYLERALNNIIVNALKYTDKGGSVSIELLRKKQEIAIVIKDTGIGISKEDIDKICNRFYQADNDINSAGGSGIGLAFSKEIIMLHGGKLHIKSKLNQGSSFIVILPLIEVSDTTTLYNDPVKAVSVSENAQNVILAKDQVFLIVDDNTEMRSYLRNILIGNKCLEAENGTEALDIVKQHTVDLIITDYMMPKMNGLQLITTLKVQNYQIPVLMLTARTDKESKLHVLRLGTDDYLTKPFEKEELLIRIQNALKNHKNRIAHIQEQELTPHEIERTSLWIQDVKNHIEQESSDPNLTQTAIADYFNLSLSTLYRKIKGETGLSPNEFITEVKLQKARGIAENNPELSLKRLSLEVGYSNSYYFSKIYYKRFGHRPLPQ